MLASEELSRRCNGLLVRPGASSILTGAGFCRSGWAIADDRAGSKAPDSLSFMTGALGFSAACC